MLCVSSVSRTLAVAGIVILIGGLGACSKKPQSGARMMAGDQGMPAVPGSSRDFTENVGKKVRFTVNSSELTPEAQATLRAQARWLQRYPQYSVLIEGHADERGTREYNLALGSRRATAVRTYLSRQGVRDQRIRTVSYGKERPVELCNEYRCWSQNRRAETALN